MRIKWKKAEGAAAYRIYRKTPSSNWKRIGTVSGSQTVFYDKTLSTYGTYYYTVRGTCGKVMGKYDTTGLKRVVPKLAAPKLLRAERDNYYGLHNWGFTYAVLLEWTPVKNAKYYCIYRRKAGSSKWIRLAKQPAYDRTTYFDSDIGLSTSYYYTVRPVICSYYGEFSRTGIYSEKDFELDIW